MNITNNNKKLYISIYYSKLLDYTSSNRYDQKCVHLIDVTYDPDDRSRELNRPAAKAGKQGDCASWETLPIYLRSDWVRAECMEVDDAVGLLPFLKETISVSFQTPRIGWGVVDRVCVYAYLADDEGTCPHIVHEHFGSLVCVDELEAREFERAFLNGDESRSDHFPDFMEMMFFGFLEEVIGRAMFDFSYHQPIDVD